jgi:DNA-binding transcriptional ArsR family regulator
MPGDANIAAVAALLADPTRAAILMALLDGRAWPAGDLARAVRVSPSTASNHLTKLVEHQLLRVEQQGRHRYFSLADPAIAQVLELLAAFAPASPVRSLRESEAARAVRAARLCYNHFAGKLGVALSQALVEKEVLTKVDGGYLVTEDGERWLQGMGIECSALKKRGQIFAPHHIDWSERLHHAAGALGAALARRFFDLGWVRRVPTNRAVRLTEEGEQALLKELGLSLTDDKDAISA